MDDISREMRWTYDPAPGEPGSHWKMKETFSPEEALQVWSSVKKRLSLGDDKDIVFVSPTANYPTHEIELFKNETTLRNGKITFLVGDLTNVKAQPALREIEGLQSESKNFTFFKWDARNLPINKGSVDVIWDRRGWIWHSTYMGENPKDETINAFKKYSNYLKTGGIIILDADYGTYSNERELSTDQMIKQKFGENFLSSTDMTDMFDLSYVGDDRLRVLVLRKKVMNNCS